jgi:hypothetical protein
MTGLMPLLAPQVATGSRPTVVIPATIAAGGEQAMRRFLESFGASSTTRTPRMVKN